MSSSNTEETLFPMFLPDDEEGFAWHVVYLTKEEVICTLEMNQGKDNEVSQKICEMNSQYIEEFEICEVSPSPLFLNHCLDVLCIGVLFIVTVLLLCLPFVLIHEW